MQRFLKISLTLCIALIGIIAPSCSSKEDELVGSWSTSFGLTNDYTQYRVYSDSEYHPTFFQTIKFSQGENGKPGTFTEVISPLVLSGQNSNELKIGSKISGTWEIKNKKLYMYFDENSFSLTNDDMIGINDKAILEDQMTQEFFQRYGTVCSNGMNFEIVKRNDKTGVEIHFGNTKVTLVKKEVEE